MTPAYVQKPSRLQLSHAEQLVESVGRLRLAVAQAASFIQETTTTLDDIVKLYKSDEVCGV